MERLPPRELIPREKWGRDAPLVQAIIDSEAYQACSTYREQCHVMYSLGKGYFLSKNYLARILGVDHKSFEKQITKPIEQRPSGRPTLLTNEEIDEFYSILQETINQQEYPTVRDALQIIIEHTGKTPSLDTVNRLIKNSSDFKIVHGIPMEESRANVERNEIDEYYQRLKQAIDGIPASMLFNIDEAGEDDYVDSYSFNVIVSINHEGNSVPIPVKRGSKRATLLHCICADGTYTKPLLILPRKSVDSVMLKRVCCENVILKNQDKGYANTEIIKYWLENEFFPLVAEKKRKRVSKIRLYRGCSLNSGWLYMPPEGTCLL